DLNCGPHTLEAAVLRSLLPHLRDAWLEVHGSSSSPSSPSSPSSSSPSSSSPHPGHTCKAAGNSFQPRRQLPSRIDYVWSSVAVEDCRLALQTTPEGHSYSDHFAVTARLALPPPPAPAAAVAAPPAPAAAAAAKEGEQQQQREVKATQEKEEEAQQQLRRQARRRQAALLRAALGVVGGGVGRASQTAGGHMLLAGIMLVQALCLCAFQPALSYLRLPPLPPPLVPLLPVLVLLLGLGAGVLGLVGLGADCGQSRALQQAALQLHVRIAELEEEGEGEEWGKEGGE
ncbi:hypothetical protein Agub_g2724, partial [Astrephomene gubernaculifera]